MFNQNAVRLVNEENCLETLTKKLPSLQIRDLELDFMRCAVFPLWL